MSENPALAETVGGIVLYITGVGAVHFGVKIAAAMCFVMVGLIACTRSYTKVMNP